VYAGAVQSGFEKQQVRANFVSQLKIPDDKVDKLFSGNLMTLKKSLSKQKAQVWQQKLSAIGAETALVPCANPQLAATESAANFELSPIEESVAKPTVNANADPVERQKPNASSEQSEHDEDMNARILKAQAMIATQQLAMQMAKKKESNPMKRLFVFTGVLCALIFMLYFYAGSMA